MERARRDVEGQEQIEREDERHGDEPAEREGAQRAA